MIEKINYNFKSQIIATEPSETGKIDLAGYFIIIPLTNKSVINVENYAYENSFYGESKVQRREQSTTQLQLHPRRTVVQTRDIASPQVATGVAQLRYAMRLNPTVRLHFIN